MFLEPLYATRGRGRRLHLLRPPDGPREFERRAVLYAYGPETLRIGSYCALAAGVRFLMPGANHADLGPVDVPVRDLRRRWETRWTS